MECHCYNDSSCNNINGTCSIGICDAGWQGSSCSQGNTQLWTFRYNNGMSIIQCIITFMLSIRHKNKPRKNYTLNLLAKVRYVIRYYIYLYSIYIKCSRTKCYYSSVNWLF
jgi:hypothetical protein